MVYVFLKPFKGEVSDASMEHMDVRELMSLDPARRNPTWLRRMVCWAVALELSTIPLYLFARWSVASSDNEVVDSVKAITLQEMAHMATAINLLKGIGGSCNLRCAAPGFPRRGLPGGVRPDLQLSLKPLSKRIVRRTFMEIERPASGTYQIHAGQTYPTIGAFYLAICDCLLRSRLTDLDTTKQLEVIDPVHGVVVKKLHNVKEAIKEIRRVVSEGEGTTASPETEPGSGILSHYWSFSQIVIGKKLVNDGQIWSYSGEKIDFPEKEQIRQLRPALAGECKESIAFDSMYTRVLDLLQKAWDKGGNEGQAQLASSFRDMGELFPLAYDLMSLPIGAAGPLGPGFHVIR